MTKEYLEGYSRCDSFIKSINDEIQEINFLKGVTKHYMNNKEVSECLEARETKLNKLLKIQEEKKAEIEAAVQAIPDERFRKLVFLRYIKRMNWEALSYEMLYSESHCYELIRAFFKKEGEKNES